MPDTNFVNGFGSRVAEFVLEIKYKDSCNVQHSELMSVSVTVNSSSFWSDSYKYYVCQGGSVQTQLYGDTTNLLWTPSVGVSNTTSASPILTPPSSLLYSVMNLNDSSSIQIEVQADTPIPNFSLNFNGTEASIPANITHTSVTWYYNGTPIMVNQDTLPIYLSGSYYAMVENEACFQTSDTLKINMKNQAQSSSSQGTTTSADSISKVTFSAMYNLGENDLTQLSFILPDEGIYKTSAINQIEVYDYSVSNTPILTTGASKVNDYLWSTPSIFLHLTGGRLYQFVIYINDSKMPLFVPDSIPFVDDNNFLTYSWSTILLNDGQVLNGMIPFMTLQFQSSISIEESTGIEHSIYPNPFNNELTVQTEGENSIVIYDALGRITMEKEFINSITLSTVGFAEGVYFYEINGVNGSASGKLIK